MRLQLFVLGPILVPAMVAAQAPQADTNCRADRTGDRLITTFAYPGGQLVEGPWRITHSRVASIDGARRGIALTAVLDRIVEFDPHTRARNATPFPTAVEVVFEGETEADVMASAARVWCATVTRARTATDATVPRTLPFRVSAAGPMEAARKT